MNSITPYKDTTPSPIGGGSGRRAIFPGSFNPFTIGHKDIVDRTLASVADKVIIAIGVNINKTAPADIEQRVSAIQKAYEGNANVEVLSYQGLTTDFAKEVNADFIVRGVRSVKDFEYERDIAEANRHLSGIETILLYTSPALSHVSSSLVRELQSYGKDVSNMLP